MRKPAYEPSPQVKPVVHSPSDIKLHLLRTRLRLQIPDGLIDTAHWRDLVIFAEAGISAEAPAVFPATFYEEVQRQFGIKDDLSFPRLMQLVSRIS